MPACHREPEWTIAAVASKLAAAGYAVSATKSPGIAGTGIVGVDCIDARRSGAVDTLCVVRCTTAASCAVFAEGTWESYGTFQRGGTVLVHQVCGRPRGYPLSFDCTAARAALGL
jgi:hypothetical protein